MRTPDPEAGARLENAMDEGSLISLNAALDHLNEMLDRFIDLVRASADDYSAAADRMDDKGVASSVEASQTEGEAAEPQGSACLQIVPPTAMPTTEPPRDLLPG
jgi:hypothetical protein